MVRPDGGLVERPSHEAASSRAQERPISPENREVLESLRDLLAVAFARDSVFSQLIDDPPADGDGWRYHPQFLFFKDVRGDLGMLEEGFFSAQLGAVEPGQLFTSTRDGFEKGLRAPKIRGVYRGGQAQLEVRPNFDASTPFDHEVLPGVKSVVVKEGEGVFGITMEGKMRPLTQEEKEKLVETFRQIAQRARRVLEANEKARARVAGRKPVGLLPG